MHANLRKTRNSWAEVVGPMPGAAWPARDHVCGNGCRGRPTLSFPVAAIFGASSPLHFECPAGGFCQQYVSCGVAQPRLQPWARWNKRSLQAARWWIWKTDRTSFSQTATNRCVIRWNQWLRRHEGTLLRRLIMWRSRARYLLVQRLAAEVDTRRTLRAQMRIGRPPKPWEAPFAEAFGKGLLRLTQLDGVVLGLQLGVELPMQPDR